MRKTLSDRGVAALKSRTGRYALPDPELRGHYIRVQPGGAKSFVAVTVDPEGKQKWVTIGASDRLTIDEARTQARDIIGRVKAGLPATEQRKVQDTFGAVAELWVKRHVVPKGLRSRDEIERLLKVHVLPEWRDREFVGIRRSDVATLLDQVEDGHSARQADIVLTLVRSMANWYATRHDGYNPPFVRGMRRQDPKAQARARVLDDDEIKAVWMEAERGGPFGAIVRLALLTAQRRSKITEMRWSDIAEGVWTVPRENQREKGVGGALALPQVALDIINAQPVFATSPYVFTGRAKGPYAGLAQAKARFDEKVPLPGWVIHDLRRTARSLMSRAGVASEIAERILGHARQGVEATYDQFHYEPQKADALARLAVLIESVVRPVDNVLPMQRTR